MDVIKLSNEAEQFLRWLAVERGRAQNTISGYRRDLGRYETFLATRGITVLNCSETDVESFLQGLQKEGQSPASTARRLAAVRMCHGFLFGEGLRNDNPTSMIEGVRVPAGVPKPLLLHEVESMLASATGEDSLSLREIGRAHV